LVPLPPALRRPPAAGAEGKQADRAARAARSRRRLVRRTRLPGRGGPAGPGRAGLGAGGPRALGPLVGLGLAGLGGTVHELLTRFPAGVIAADAELAARVAGDQLARGSLEEAERCLDLATRTLESVPADRRGRAQVVLAVMRMRLARQRGDLTTVAGEAQR